MYYTSTSRVPALLPLGGVHPVNRLLDEALSAFVAPRDHAAAVAAAWVPPCDIQEEENAVRLEMEVPGVAASDIRVSLEGNRLSIRGEKRAPVPVESDRAHRLERTYGSFERVFTLPATLDGDRIEARIENGILSLRLAKVERARPRDIPVRGPSTPAAG